MAQRPQHAAAPRAPLALWVGPEPTVNRVGDQYFDQIESSGLAHRLDDIDRLASLGATRLRLPLLWERIAPRSPTTADWRWADARMQRLREVDLAPIVGLLHHGSGPPDTQLLDPALPARLAAYAHAVAARYPWIDAWTPVNEPLTTARFSGLYGLWYPHRRDDRAFVRALLQQAHAIVAAMQAVRAVNPQAQLVQTEDLGCTRSTAPLAYQAQFENERRWLSFDLLCGRVDRQHPLHDYLRHHGAGADELAMLAARPCPPDIVGINAYVTSERFLDHRIERYRPELVGGNGRDRYADIEAVRACRAPIGSFEARLREAHARYRLPLAITEAHLGCTREEQMRWLLAAWRAAQAARAAGADVRAVTAWAAFGATDWNSLVTRRAGHYEPGLWDIRAPHPRPTALAALARELAAGGAPAHPLLQVPGWWQRDDRLHGACADGQPAAADHLAMLPATHAAAGTRRDSQPDVADRHAAPAAVAAAATPDPRARDAGDCGTPPLLITGATGTLGRAFARICVLRGIPYRLLRRAELDIADAASVAAAFERWQPWAVLNTAGFVRVDDAERDPRCLRENALGPELLARACQRAGIALVTFSSDLVFDGRKGDGTTLQPYVESDAPQPLNAYGRAKLAGERAALGRCERALVIRSAAFFGPWDAHNFVTRVLARLRQRERVTVAVDQWVSPTYVPHLADATLDLLIDDERGIWHLANRGLVSWAELARAAAQMAGLDAGLVRAVPGRELAQPAVRPRCAALASERGWPLPALDQALAQYMHEVGGAGQHAAPSSDHGPAAVGAATRAVAAL